MVAFYIRDNPRATAAPRFYHLLRRHSLRLLLTTMRGSMEKIKSPNPPISQKFVWVDHAKNALADDGQCSTCSAQAVDHRPHVSSDQSLPELSWLACSLREGSA